MEEPEDEIPPILVINDDPETLRLIAQALDEEGFEVKQAENGRRALFMLTGFRPILIVTDMMMPEMNGLEFCKQLEHYDVKDIPVLVVTSASEKSRLMREFFELPLIGRGYLKDPFDPQALARKVLEMLEAADEGRVYSDATSDAPADDRAEGIIKPLQVGREVRPDEEPTKPYPEPPHPAKRAAPPQRVDHAKPEQAAPPTPPPPRAEPAKLAKPAAPATPPPPKRAVDQSLPPTPMAPLAKGKAKLAPRAPRPAPAAATPPPPASPPAPAQPIAAQPVAAAPSPAGPRLRVLLIDDDDSILDMVRMTLEAQHEIRTASSGEEGLAALDDFQPDFAICDVSMPGMGGLATVEALRHHPICGSIPVFFLTGEKASDLPRKAYDIGANLFLSKPILPSRLVRLIDQLIKETDLKSRPKVPVANRPEPSHAPRGDDAPTPLPHAMGPVRILAVDDNPGTLASIRRTLESQAPSEGWELLFSADPREAIAHLSRWEPDAILYNPRCRNVDGIAFVQTLRMKKLMGTLEIAFIGKEFFDSDRDFSASAFKRDVIKLSASEPEIVNAILDLAAAAAAKARPKSNSIELVLAEDELRRGQARSKQAGIEMQRDLFRAKFGKLQQMIDEEA